MSSYVFDNTKEPSCERLSFLQSVCDAATIGCLQRIGVAPGWACLEIGAGGGSIADWLSERVGGEGAVVVTDIEPRFLDGLARGRPNVQIRRHDIVADSLPEGAFDLIHARHVFVHVANAPALLPKLKAALKPGGWLVIEDFDPIIDRTALICDRSKAQALDRVADGIWKLFAKHGGTGINWGRQLPAHFKGLGMSSINVEVSHHCATAGSSFAEFHKITFARTRAEGVAAGFASDQDYDTAIALMDDPATLYYSNPVFTAWCQRPASQVRLDAPGQRVAAINEFG
jgi:SAM-dependent methyltransferase